MGTPSGSTPTNQFSAAFPEAQPYSPQRQASITSSLNPQSIASDNRRSTDLSPSWAQQSQPPAHWVERKLQIHQSHRRGDDDDDFYYDDEGEYEEEEWDEEEEAEVNEIRFFQPAFLSEAALQLRDRVERRRHTKAGIAWVGSFTGRDVVVSVSAASEESRHSDHFKTAIQGFLPSYTREAPTDRRFALVMAQSLQTQLWIVEVDWDDRPLRDSSEDVFRFMGEMEGMSSGDALTTELPKGVMTMATRCYSPSCSGDSRCYAPRCPYKTPPDTFLRAHVVIPPTPTTSAPKHDWTDEVDPMLIRELSPEQIERQTIIHKVIESEIQYEADLTAIDRFFIEGLRSLDVIRPPRRLEDFITEVFSNVLDLREACRRLIDNFSIRQREQAPLIATVGDIFLEAATDFRRLYPEYTGNLPRAEIALKAELEENPEFRLYAERIARENDRRMDVKVLIARPSAQLQRYPAIIEALLNKTHPQDPDHDFLVEALSSIQDLSAISQLKLFHASRGRGPASKLQWYDIVLEPKRALIEEKEQVRQM